MTTSLPNHISSAAAAWRSALQDKVFSIQLLVVPGLFFIYSSITQHLGNYIEQRKGAHLEDQLLTFFPKFDFSVPVFYLLYFSLFAFILTHSHKPRVILRLIEMHFLVAIIRQACILLVALDPPAGIIVLKDVFLENTFYPHHTPMTKDLFFSGHVASLWIYFLCSGKKYLKVYFALATVLMTFMILSMRVHYTYDVYGAIFFTTVIFFAPVWIKPYFASNGKLSMSKQRV